MLLQLQLGLLKLNMVLVNVMVSPLHQRHMTQTPHPLKVPAAEHYIWTRRTKRSYHLADLLQSFGGVARKEKTMVRNFAVFM